MNKLARPGVPGDFRCLEPQDKLVAGVVDIGYEFRFFFENGFFALSWLIRHKVWRISLVFMGWRIHFMPGDTSWKELDTMPRTYRIILETSPADTLPGLHRDGSNDHIYGSAHVWLQGQRGFLKNARAAMRFTWLQMLNICPPGPLPHFAKHPETR